MNDQLAEAILKELEMLRKLKMIEFLEKSYSQAQLGKVLGVSQQTVSRMVPKITPNKK